MRIRQYQKNKNDKGQIIKPTLLLGKDCLVSPVIAPDVMNIVSMFFCRSIFWSSKVQSNIELCTIQAEYNSLSRSFKQHVDEIGSNHQHECDRMLR